jgi:hypothetical protein
MLDHISDKNHAYLYKIYNAVVVPEFVKEAELLDASDRQSMEKTAFADPSKKLFPIVSKADTWLSCAFYHKYAEKQDKSTENRLKEAAKLWDLDFDTIKTQVSAVIHKEAGVSHSISFEVEGKTISKVHICALSDLEKTAEFLQKNATSYPFSTRKSVAEQILRVAERFTEKMSNEKYDMLEKLAAHGTTTPDNALQAVKTRKSVCKAKFPEFVEKLEVVEKELQKVATEFVKPALLEKTAAILDVIDRFTDMHVKYGPNFKSPEQSLFEVTPTKMQVFQKKAVTMATGDVLSESDIQANAEDIKSTLENVCNYKVAAEESLGKVLANLSERDAKIIVKLLQSVK